MFINAGLDKFLHYMPVPTDIPEEMMRSWHAFNEIGWMMPLVGFAEILGGVLLIIPKTRALGAIVILPGMAGILLTSITTASGLPFTMVLLAIEFWIIYENREKYLPMIQYKIA
jgi:uncharacterized membrane protein YphA (DoxX/SURF4 family)